MKEESINLNKKQKEAVDYVIKYINNRIDKPFISISGRGGSGKTFLLRYAIKGVLPSRIVGATISHFAKKVLQDSLGPNYNVTTIAALLGKKVSYDKETGKLIMISTNNIPPIEFYDIVIIDEASMIDDKLFHELMSYGKKIIAIGDKYQLPPVEQDHDSKFLQNVDVELDEVMRFNESIETFSKLFIEEIRKYNEGYNIDKFIVTKVTKGRVSYLDNEGSGYIFLKDFKELIRLAVHDFMTNPDINSCRIIAYKNKTLDKLNNIIRRRLFGKDLEKYEIGELIISDGGYGKYIKNGDIFKVIGIKRFEDEYGVECAALSLSPPVHDLVKTVTNEGMQRYDEIESYLKKRAQSTKYWKEYKNFLSKYAQFKYSYAVSVHKAQGASINNVYVFEGEIMGVRPITIKEKFQSLYVAVTRAKHRVYVYNKKYSVDNDFISLRKNKYKKDEST